PVTADVLREGVREELLRALEKLGGSEVAEEFTRLSALPAGSTVQWASSEGNTSGQVLGLGPHGELRVRAGDGREIPLFAEEVRILKV
ncbi:MAG: hypothetical protein ACXVBW_10720, partial [Bdellovibrionota bacterium]